MLLFWSETVPAAAVARRRAGARGSAVRCSASGTTPGDAAAVRCVAQAVVRAGVPAAGNDGRPVPLVPAFAPPRLSTVHAYRAYGLGSQCSL
jgi:hypothetical protein